VTTRSQQTEMRRWLLPFLAALVGVLAVIGLAGTASANERGVSQNGVGAISRAVEVLVEPPQHETAGQHPGRAEDSAETAVATGVAAKALTPLEQGAAKVPSEWGPGMANRDLGGTRWFDPSAPEANGIRIDEGVPHSPFPSQQVDHVIVRSGGRILGPDGKPIVGSLKQNPDAHIPLSDWLNWTSWNAP
jgi:hypothetical protein